MVVRMTRTNSYLSVIAIDFVLCVATLVPTHSFACDPAALRNNVDRLEESDSPFAGTITFDCIDVLRDPNNEILFNKFISDFVNASEVSKNINAASTIDKCSAEQIQVACFKASD
jgi:hypothetical protein